MVSFCARRRRENRKQEKRRQDEIYMGSWSIFGMPIDDVLDVLKKLGMSEEQLKLASVICYQLKQGKIRLKDVNKMAEDRNFKLLKKEWNYNHESSDAVLALRKFQLNTKSFCHKREERSSLLTIQIGKICGIDILSFTLGSIQAKRGGPLSDVDLKCIVGAPDDVPKLRLLTLLGAYYIGEVICPSILTSDGIRSKEELYTAATYRDPSILRFYWLDPPCRTTSDSFLEEIRSSIYSGVKKFYTISSLCKEVQKGVRNYGKFYKELLFNETDIQFRKFLKLLDLGFQHACLKRGGLTYAAEYRTFWDRIQTIPSKTRDYKELEWDLGSLLINVEGAPRGYLNLSDRNRRRAIYRIIRKYCTF